MSDGSIVFDTKIDGGGLSKGLSSIGGIVAKGIAAATAAVAGLGAAVIKVGSDFESAFAGVKKTVDATDTELAALRDGILDMAKRMPIAATEIASIAEAAGQLGIQNKNILGFTEVMANLGVATNMASTEAATALARLANITGMSQTDFDRLGSTIVALGNNLATTESEIVDMSMRIAGAGAQVGMTEAQIMAFSGALSSVGINAEAGGTAFSTLISKMSLATAKGGEELDGFAKVAGMSGEQFKKAFEQDASTAIITFIQGLKKINDEGGSAIGTLDEMGLSDIRMRDALLRAAGASDVFSESLDIANSAWDKNTALVTEAEQRYATFDSRLKILKNTAVDAGITIFEGMKDNLKGAISNATQWMAQLGDAYKQGGMDAVIPALGEVLSEAITYISAQAPGMIDAGMNLLESLIQGLTNNIGLITEAAVKIVVRICEGLLTMLPMLLTAALEIIKGLAKGISEALPTLIPKIVDVVMQIVQTLVDNIPMLIEASLQLIMGLAKGLIAAIPVLIDALPGIIDSLINGLLKSIPLIIQCGIDLLTSLVEALPDIIKKIVEALPKIIDGIINALLDNIPIIIQAGIDLLVSLIQALPTIITTIVKAIPQIITGLVNAIIGNIDKIIMAGVELLISLVKNTPKIIVEVVKAIPQIIKGLIDAIIDFVPKMANAGLNLIKGLWNGIKDAGAWLWDKISGFFDGIMDSIKGFFGIHSPSMLFEDLIGKNLMLGLAVGIDENASTVEDSMDDISKKVASTKFSLDNVNTSDIFNGVNTDDLFAKVRATVDYNQSEVGSASSARVNFVQAVSVINDDADTTTDASGQDVFVNITLEVDGKELSNRIAVPMGKALNWVGV